MCQERLARVLLWLLGAGSVAEVLCAAERHNASDPAPEAPAAAERSAAIAADAGAPPELRPHHSGRPRR